MRLAVYSLALACCGAGYPQFDEPRLVAGRAIWLGTCSACHGNPDADAPQLGDRSDWAPRVARGVESLYASALGGRSGPGGTVMPPRGGNPALSDDQVRTAVDYMIRASTQP